MKAHRRGLGVVGLSLTPWGDDSDRKRWRGIEGLTYLGHTQKVVDFVLGRSTPEDALGNYTRKRKRESASFDADEPRTCGSTSTTRRCETRARRHAT